VIVQLLFGALAFLVGLPGQWPESVAPVCDEWVSHELTEWGYDLPPDPDYDV
jgi:hypothetical protein